MTAALIVAGIAVTIAGMILFVVAFVNLDKVSVPAIVLGVVGIIGGPALLIWAAVRHDAGHERDCLASGGAWVVDHYSTTYVMSGKVLVPVRSAVHKCIDPTTTIIKDNK